MSLLFIDTSGSPGGPKADSFTFVQAVPSADWIITHNLGRHPAVAVVTTSGDLVDCAVAYPSDQQVVLTFFGGFAGTAYLD